jgi:MscS family membrane protein
MPPQATFYDRVIYMLRTIKKPGVLFSTLVSVLFLLLALSVPVVKAQDNNTASELAPLRPADTSSPRDTLRSFLSDINLFISDYRQGSRSEQTYQAYRRASQALDYSTTPDGDSWFVRNRRIALLYELLARLELPQDNLIPGDDEVADGDITQWTIPDTTITITKIEHGPRAGQFLFSDETVQQLDRLYRQARDLPYRQGAITGLYEALFTSDAQVQGLEQQIRERLKPVDTSSPRSTHEGFLDSVNRAYMLVMETNTALRATPPTMTIDEALEIEKTAAIFLRRATGTLDLSQVPKALRQDVSVETVLQLKEILDRMLLPPIDTIPNARMVATARKEASELSSQTAAPFRWRIPNTQIEIVEILEGEQQGQFLFSAGTVRRISDVYQRIRDLPYRQAEFGGTELEYQSPHLSPGFYQHYISTSGYLISQARFLGRLVDDLPDWFKKLYAGQTVWQWMGFIFSVIATALVAYGANRYIWRLAKRVKPPLHDWLKLVSPIIVLIIVITAGKFINEDLKFSGDIHAAIAAVIASIVFVLAAWAVYVLCKAVAETIIATPKIQHQSSEAALLRIGARVIGFLVAAWIIIDGIRALGADLIPLLAGLGVGGIAVALAAQSTIANFIGGLIIFANKPVRVGDFCRYGEDPSSDWLRIGTVEEIGLISTRIRGIDRTVTTIPNAEFSNMHIINLTKRDRRLLRTRLQLRYETTPEQMRFILLRIRELLLGHPMVTPDPARVRFLGYSAYSKDVEIFCYLRCMEQNEFLAIQEDVLLRVEDIIKEAGSGFAFPSQTAYLARDAGLDDKRRSVAETEVEHLRFTGKLPFPEFDEEEREQLEDILDYPPRGSPDYKPR